MTTTPPPITWTAEEGNRLHDEWRFNCGPAAICAVTGLTPAQLRPHMGDFEDKGYTNPTLMYDVLRRLGVRYDLRVTREADPPRWPSFGLARIQWDGPWCRPGVPVQARYRHTHWVASHGAASSRRIFDVNATCAGGWLPLLEWSDQLVPWLLKQVEPKASGRWWITHALEVDPR